MTMTVREAFDRRAETFNAHDIYGFEEVLADSLRAGFATTAFNNGVPEFKIRPDG